MLPPLPAGEYLAAAFHEIGRVSSGFSPIPLTWAEIDAYARVTGEITEPWEAKIIRSMSHEYLRGMSIGENPLGRAPWSYSPRT